MHDAHRHVAVRRTAAPQTAAQGYHLGDAVGAAAAALVVLPQAMAYGVALFALLGRSASSGALAGLLGAVLLGLLSGLCGGTVGLVSSPTGPVLALLSGAVASFVAVGLSGVQLFTALMATTILAGLFQMAIALSGGGRLITFIPYPVVVGFTTGAALLMIQSQLKAIFGPLVAQGGAVWPWLPLLTALATYLCIIGVARRLPQAPPMLAGLLGGTLIFQLCAALAPDPLPTTWLVGALPELQALAVGFAIRDLAALPAIPIVSAALALAMLASLNTMLASVIADVTTEQRHNARQELLAQGIGQALTGALGSMGGSATTGATVVAVRAGARRRVGVMVSAVLALLILVCGSAGRFLPISVLAGIVIYVAVGMFGADAFAWLRSGRTRTEALVALLVTIVTVAYDLVTAVGAGVVLAIILFIREQGRTPVIHRRSTGEQRHSVRRRPSGESALLEQHGNRIVLCELRGNLFFATADRLFAELLPDLERSVWVILHLRRVSQIDLTGLNILHQIASRLHAHGGQLAFCEVHQELGLGSDVAHALSHISQQGTGARQVLTFVDSDAALEAAENALLTTLGFPPARAHEPAELAATDLCQDMTPAQALILRAVLRASHVAAGQKLFAAGEYGDTMYLVLRGEVDMRLQTTRHHYKRLANCGPGTFFGEIAFLDPGPRTADAMVRQPTDLLMLDRDGLAQLQKEHPDVAVSLLVALGKIQGYHLRRTAEEIQRLAQW